MSDLSELERLITMWRNYPEMHPAADQFSRGAGFNSALRICAEQLAEAVKELRGE